MNLPVINLGELPNFERKPSTMFYIDEISFFEKFFDNHGIQTLALTDVQTSENLYQLYVKHLSELYAVHEMLADEESKSVFRAAIKGKLTRRIKDFRYVEKPHYFLEGFLPVEGDIAIDGGAYDGKTSRDFVMQGAKVYSFEMSRENYQNCLPLAEKYNFTMENLGLSNREGQEFYAQSGAGSGKGRGNLVGNFIDLDTYVLKKDLPRVDYIKLDIEGAELDMLHGAIRTITLWKPKMAICAYHKPEDLWTLASYVKYLHSDYEIKFRHNKVYLPDSSYQYTLNEREKAALNKFGMNNGFAPSFWDMVLYCR